VKLTGDRAKTGKPTLALALLLLGPLAGASLAEEPPQPFEVWGGWHTCPSGYWISHGKWPWRDGPVVEYGGEPDKPFVGNVGNFGAPYMSYASPAVGGIGVVGGFGGVVIIGR
jgi:hypothetical protein